MSSSRARLQALERSYDAVLYRNIVSCDQSVRHQRRNAKAIETSRQQADLRNHVRKIAVQRWHPSEATCHQIGHTIKSCPATGTVLMSLAWSTKVWPIIHAVGKLPHLEVLRHSAYADGPSLQMILGHFNQPTLRELGLCRYGLGKGDAPMAPWVPTEPPSQDQNDKLSVIACSYSSGIPFQLPALHAEQAFRETAVLEEKAWLLTNCYERACGGGRKMSGVWYTTV